MNILKPDYDWARPLIERQLTTHCIIHHEGVEGDVTPEQIHAYHLSKGWAGIAYHIYVRKDGTVYEGRPIKTVGGHTTNWNYCSIGVCFEGNFQEEEMSEAQLKAGEEVVEYIRKLYPNIIFGKHSSFGATACPGKNLPFEDIVDGVETANATAEPVEAWKIAFYEEAIKLGLITDTAWKDKLNEPAPVWLVFALATRAKQ